MMRLQRGVALIFALWSLALLSILMGSVIAAIRLENHQSTYEFQRSRALIVAEAGLSLAIRDSLSVSGPGMKVDGQPVALDFEGSRLTLEVRSERGKLDVNFCTLESLMDLLRYNGADTYQIEQIAEYLRYRREIQLLLSSLEELHDFPAMTPELYERILPQVTIWTGLSVPEPAYASDDVRAALGVDKSMRHGAPGSIVGIRSVATLSNGFRAGLDVVVQLFPNGSNSEVYRVLHWQERVD